MKEILATAEAWMAKMVKEPGHWRGTTQLGNSGQSILSLWRTIGPASNHHCVLQMISGKKPIEYEEVYLPFMARVAKGVGRLIVGREHNLLRGAITGSRKRSSIHIDQEFTLAAGSIFEMRTQTEWFCFNPENPPNDSNPQPELFLLRVNGISSDADYLLGDHASQKNLEWLLKQFEGIYG